MKRRTVLGLGLVGVGAGTSLIDISEDPPLRGLAARPGLPWSGLLRTCPELDRTLTISGAWPTGLRGALYRNGPGRLERGGAWKRSLLDGDGFVQAFHVADGQVRYRSRYVQTAKYRAEEAAGRFTASTWSTQAPGGLWANVAGRKLGYQAGITVIRDGADLLAFDEPGHPYALDPETLATREQTALGLPGAVYNAHSRVHAGERLLFGLEYGRVTTIHAVARAGGVTRWYRTFETPEAHFVHDWFVTPRWCVLLLQPLIADALPFLAGQRSLMSCLEWWPWLGTRVLMIPRDGVGAPRWLEHDPVLFLHGINGFDDGDEVVVDLVTYDHPSTLFGANALLANVAADTLDRSVAPGRSARWRLSPGTGKVRSEPLPFTDCEMPVLLPADVGRPYASAWAVTASSVPVLFFHGVARLDLGTGRADRFDYGPQVFLSEPAPTADGHLLVHGLDGAQDRSFLAVFRAAAVAAGPVATAWLDRGVHPGFHGCWDDRA